MDGVHDRDRSRGIAHRAVVVLNRQLEHEPLAVNIDLGSNEIGNTLICPIEGKVFGGGLGPDVSIDPACRVRIIGRGSVENDPRPLIDHLVRSNLGDRTQSDLDVIIEIGEDVFECMFFPLPNGLIFGIFRIGIADHPDPDVPVGKIIILACEQDGL